MDINGSLNDQTTPGSLKTMLIRGTGMGGGIGSVLYSERAQVYDGIKREYYLYNAIGSTIALTNDAGETTSTTSYEAFGKEVASSGETENNLKFSTKERSESIGLDNFGFRYFDWELGRFLTRDPSGYPDGPNNYLYAKNDPVNKIDPLGLSTVVRKGNVHIDNKTGQPKRTMTTTKYPPWQKWGSGGNVVAKQTRPASEKEIKQFVNVSEDGKYTMKNRTDQQNAYQNEASNDLGVAHKQAAHVMKTMAAGYTMAVGGGPIAKGVVKAGTALAPIALAAKDKLQGLATKTIDVVKEQAANVMDKVNTRLFKTIAGDSYGDKAARATIEAFRGHGTDPISPGLGLEGKTAGIAAVVGARIEPTVKSANDLLNKASSAVVHAMLGEPKEPKEEDDDSRK